MNFERTFKPIPFEKWRVERFLPSLEGKSDLQKQLEIDNINDIYKKEMLQRRNSHQDTLKQIQERELLERQKPAMISNMKRLAAMGRQIVLQRKEQP